MKTKQVIVTTFGPEHPAMSPATYQVVIPAGTRVKPCNDGSGQFWVDDLSWIKAGSMLHHDATHYGIRLNADQVEQ
jgi:hypothetical protein